MKMSLQESKDIDVKKQPINSSEIKEIKSSKNEDKDKIESRVETEKNDSPSFVKSTGTQESENIDSDNSITEEELLYRQTLMPGESQPENIKFLKSGRDAGSDSSETLEEAPLDSVTGLPHPAPKQKSTSQSTSDQLATSKTKEPIMGSNDSKQVNRNDPKYIMSEEPQFLNQRKRVEESETTGNCIPWSDHVYYKLFLDTEGRNARLMVLKCEISFVDVFTDEEHSLYKSRFIGGKADAVAELLAFDLMKCNWEKKIPQSQAVELNVDIVMSSSPIHQCCETLLNLFQLEKNYLKHNHFDGQLNVMIRFAHPYAWDVKDDVIRKRVRSGLCALFREGVNLEVMSADNILEEMRVDGILTTNDEKIKYYVTKRHSWKGRFIKNDHPQSSSSSIPAGSSETKSSMIDYNYGDVGLDDARATSSRADDTLASMTDAYYVNLHSALWDIIQDTKRIRGILEETIDGS